jgi:hypothetical protein
MVQIRDLESIQLGRNITIYCDLFNEPLSGLIWRRYTNYNLTLVKNLLVNNLPERYMINNTFINNAYSVSALSIFGVSSEDYATFECSSMGLDRKNLTQNCNFHHFLSIMKVLNQGIFQIFFPTLVPHFIEFTSINFYFSKLDFSYFKRSIFVLLKLPCWTMK